MLLPPIGLFAVLAYQQQGLIDWRLAVLLCVGFLAGSPFGANAAVVMPPGTLKKVFGVSLVIIGVYMTLARGE